jgi:hypothetical protein
LSKIQACRQKLRSPREFPVAQPRTRGPEPRRALSDAAIGTRLIARRRCGGTRSGSLRPAGGARSGIRQRAGPPATRSRATPLWKAAPARTRGTRCGAFICRQHLSALARSLNAMSRPLWREPATPLVTRWRRRTVAKGDSITLAVRRWTQRHPRFAAQSPRTLPCNQLHLAARPPGVSHKFSLHAKGHAIGPEATRKAEGRGGRIAANMSLRAGGVCRPGSGGRPAAGTGVPRGWTPRTSARRAPKAAHLGVHSSLPVSRASAATADRIPAGR